MKNDSHPLVDAGNPLYCPAIPASSYLGSIRRQIISKARLASTAVKQGIRTNYGLNTRLLFAFARISDEEEPLRCGAPDFLVKPSANEELHAVGAQSIQLDPWVDDSDSMLTACNDSLDHDWDRRSSKYLPPSHRNLFNAKRKRLDSFTDLRGPHKYARSIQSVHDSSFDVGIAQEALNFAPDGHISRNALRDSGHIDAPRQRTVPDTGLPGSDYDLLVSRLRLLEEDLFGAYAGAETPNNISAFISRLDELIPGVRLKERILELTNPTHQQIASLLGQHGLLNAKVLHFLRTTEIKSLRLTASLCLENGLNMSGDDILPIFGKPNSFLFLTQLSLAGATLRDSDLIHIHHLPRLAILSLSDTSIGNEAVFLLTSLKRSLTHLSLAQNPLIDDDAIPALLLLSKLLFLSVFDTNVNMPGLRRLARVVVTEQRDFHLECPAGCEKYLIALDTKYLVNPMPPLIISPHASERLSANALKRNLAAHAACNPNISITGSKVEMMERLRNILQMREADLLLQAVVFDFVDAGDECS